MRRILVTGGAGYIGSHCCKTLAQSGFEPVVYDNFSTGIRKHVRWGPVIEGDIRDGVALRAAFREVKPAAIIHFAALALVGESEKHPDRYWDVNVGGTLRLLEAMRDESVPCLVFSSTCAVYGEPEDVPIRETAPHRPVSPYGASKSTCERIMLDFERAYGLRSMRLRYFNAAGADADAEIGEWHEPETHLIPVALDAVIGRRSHLEIFGSDYPTPDGTAVRDYLHVLDLAAAHVAAVEMLLEGAPSDALNLGTGRGTSVTELIRAVEAATGKAVPVRPAPRRAGDPPALVADPARAESVLGWRAKRDLDDMIATAWRWHQKLAGFNRRD
jgi:UDP-glucose-4-epimerase GalE